MKKIFKIILLAIILITSSSLLLNLFSKENKDEPTEETDVESIELSENELIF